MICEEDLVGDMEGEDDAEVAAPPRSPEEIFLTNLLWCCSLDLGLNKVLEAHGVSGVVKGVGNPEEPTLQLRSPFSDNCGLDGVDVLMRLEAKFFIMDIKESALEIFCNLCICLPPALEATLLVFKADKGCKVRPEPEAALLDSMDSILDSYKSSEPDV